MMAQRSSFALDVLSVCMIVFGLLFTSTINAANSVINYTTSNGTIVVPQGNFYNSSGNQVSLCSSTASTLKYDEEITKIGSYAFHNCTELTSITIPNTVTDIEYFAFSNCKKLSTPVFNSLIFARLPESFNSSFSIPVGIIKIASAAFRNCTKLPSVSIPAGVEFIDKSAFSYCSSLTSITIPGSVTKIDEYAFESCTNLTSIYVGTIPAQIAVSAFHNVDKNKCTLFVPTGNKNKYSTTDIWKEFSNIKEYTPEEDDTTPAISYTETVTLSDAAAYTNSNQIYAASFSYSRMFKVTTWGTIILPVALDYEDWCSKFEIAEISGVNATFASNGQIESFTVQKTVLGAGSTTVPSRPYLIRAKVANSNTAQTISKKNCVVYPAEDKTVEFSCGNYSFQFKGTYSKIVAPNLDGKYIVSGGNWIAAKSTSSMSPMRVYLEINRISGASQAQTSEDDGNGPDYTITMSFSDGTAYTGTTTEYAALFSYSRMFKVTTWGTIVLPVALDYEDWCSKFEIAEISGVNANFASNGQIESFTVQKTVLGAGSTTVPNRPYLIRAKVANSKTAQTISKKNCVVYPAEDKIVEFSCGNYSFQFKGTYSKIVVPNLDGKYIVSGGNWIAAKSTSSLSPMRVYLEISRISEASQAQTSEEDSNGPKYTTTLSFPDGTAYIGTTTEYAALFSYSRIFKVTTWGTIVLPIALDYEDWCSKFEIAEISGVNATFASNGQIESFTVQKTVLGAGSTTVPNRPYLIRAKVANSNTAQTISKKNCVVYPAEDKTVEFSCGNYSFQFKGTYSKIVAPNLVGKYFVSGGKWIAASSTTSMSPMRVFLEIKSNSSSLAKERFGETDVEIVEDNPFLSPIIISSRFIGLAPGNYTINGKRTIVTK